MNPYTYLAAEQLIINTNPPSESKDWERSIFDKIKENVKRHLLLEQNNICPYCRSRLRLEIMYPHVEHIVHKSKHFCFMFEGRNLVMSCQPCNISKGEEEALINPLISIYPNRGDEFCIIHPYFDFYFDHIELRGAVSCGKTDKGETTIKFCDLNREQLITKREEIRKLHQQRDLLLSQAEDATPELKTSIDIFCAFVQSLE